MTTQRLRFTPTYVGTITARTAAASSSPVHPHVRGDNLDLVQPAARSERFTPTCVGTMNAVTVANGIQRFTPTCVGTISPIRPRNSTRPVHPHVRGDNEGSLGRRRRFLRFTPTCVGTIVEAIPVGCVVPVHPHVRGDNLSAGLQCRDTAGSPPRAWGQ